MAEKKNQPKEPAGTTATAITPESGKGATAVQEAPKKHKEGKPFGEHLKKAYDLARERVPRSFWWALGIGLGLIAVVLLIRWFWLSGEAAESARWAQLDQAIFPAQVESMATDKQQADAAQTRLAKFDEARGKLSRGLLTLATGVRIYAMNDLKDARTIYEELGKEAGRSPLLHQEALGGAARANEALGEIAKAEEYYKRLQKEYSESYAGKDAKRQLDRLLAQRARNDFRDMEEAMSRGGK